MDAVVCPSPPCLQNFPSSQMDSLGAPRLLAPNLPLPVFEGSDPPGTALQGALRDPSWGQVYFRSMNSLRFIVLLCF